MNSNLNVPLCQGGHPDSHKDTPQLTVLNQHVILRLSLSTKHAAGQLASATAGIVVRPTMLHRFITAESPSLI